MDRELLSIGFLVGLAVLLALGFPIGTTVFILAGLGIVMVTNIDSGLALATAVFSQFSSWSLTALPLFVLMGEIILLVGLVPGMSIFAGLYFTWLIVLLATTAASSTKQGLHDRVANSAVVRPINAGNGLVMACAVIAIVLAALALFSIVALIFLGGQVSSILSGVGESI